MSEFSIWDFFFGSSRNTYSDSWARREASHQAYLERQREREERHQAYLERQARREANRAAYYERITNNVLRFKAQYEATIESIRNQGMDVYIRPEYDSIMQQLQSLDGLIASENIEAARDLSLAIGQSIHSLIPLARKEKKRIENLEQQKQKEEEERQRKEIQQQARKDFIDQMRRNLESDKDSNPDAVQEAVKKLDDLKERVSSMSGEDLQEQLITESDKVDGEIADETVRREVIKAIYQSLKKTGFIVSTPQLSGDVVLLRAQKPAGQQAEFAVKLDGELSYKFDNYEGQKCRKDIDAVTALLDECYGITLNKRKVVWSNPDRIQKGSKDNPEGGVVKSSSK